MRSAIRIGLATAAVMLFALSAFAALSQEYVDFGKGPAQYLMSKDELAKWKTITNDADAKAFVELFWLRRDPSPNTPANEFKTAFEQRVKLADERFGTRRTVGSMTDRGRALIVLGNPTEAVKQEKMPAMGAVPGARDTSADETAAPGQPNMPQTDGMRQVWTYDPAKVPYKPLATALGDAPVLVSFVDPTGGGDFRFERTRKSPDYIAVLEKVAAAYISQPNITSGAQQTTTTTTTTVTKGPAAPPAGTIKTPALQAAVDEVKAGKSAIARGAYIASAELVSPAGDYFVPVQLYLPKASGLAVDAADTFFGTVEDSTGAQVFAFEEPAKLTVSQGDLFVDKTLNLGTGKYTAILGLAKAGVPVVLASKTLDLNTIAKDAVGTSKLILSANVYETTEAAPVKAPFAFGKLKIVPKANFVFSNKDELTYFIELHNPGIDPATSLPKVQAKLELFGGKLAKPIMAPLSDAVALPLSGAPGPGQYAVISSIPFAEMSKPLDAGDYTLKVKLIDTVSKQTYNLEQSFKIGS